MGASQSGCLGGPPAGSPSDLSGNFFFDNIMLLSDSYKTSHWRQYPPGTTEVYSYFESRGGKFDDVCFFGLQYFLKRYMTGVVVDARKIAQAKAVVNAHMGLGEMQHFNEEGWTFIMNQCGGKLPLAIKAVPEGMNVPVKNVLMTVVNTKPEAYWLTNYMETMLVQVWYPMTVATQSRAQKKVILDAHIKTGCSTGMLDIAYKLNDFGCRGVSSMESAAIGGAAHLVNFGGSDTMPGLCLSVGYYGQPIEQVIGTSVPAAEHSTITSWGKDGEVDAFRNMLTQYPKGLVAVVSDSYDIYNACEKLWGTELKDLIKSREPPTGRLIVRPDSGDPPQIVVEVMERLAKNFPPETNAAGYKTLPPYIRVIQGDGISYESMQQIYENVIKNKWSADNLAFGSGGALLQRMDRDTQKCAFKCCEITVKGEKRNVFKDPITDKGKASKKGQLKLVRENGKLVTKTEGQGAAKDDLLVEVFRDGAITKSYTFPEVRALSEEGLPAKIWG
jgi:nicotinamide phosphoribosyltransferase